MSIGDDKVIMSRAVTSGWRRELKACLDHNFETSFLKTYLWMGIAQSDPNRMMVVEGQDVIQADRRDKGRANFIYESGLLE